MDKKVTMQDIANQLNISKNSVSQALTGKPGVSEETRELVRRTAEELGYSFTNIRTHKQPEQKENKNIALIASDYAFSLKSFFGEIYLSVEKELRSRGMNLYIESINQSSKEKLILPALLTNQKIDGILILSHISTEYIQKVLSTGIPTVLVDHHSPYLQADSILTNNRFGAFTAVEHLIKLGHQEIAFVGNTEVSPSYQERRDGYLLALEKYGITPKPEFMFTSVQETQEDILSIMESLTTRPTAWFCVNDGFGFLVQSTLQQKGFKIPEDASVCSFDNGQLSQIATPKITTMEIDLNLFGKQAVDQLCWRINHKHDPIHEVLLPTTLLIRDSTSVRRDAGTGSLSQFPVPPK